MKTSTSVSSSAAACRSPPARAAFIAGLPRSGTSLMARLLDGHPRALVLPRETHVEDWCGSPDPVAALLAGTRWREVAEAAGPRGPRLLAALRRLLPRAAAPRAALLALAEAWWEACERPARDLWVEKTPRHLRVLPVLAAAFGPATRFVLLVRGPRQVLASTRQRWGQARRHEVGRFARRWALAVDVAARLAARREDVLVMRYEDLVQRPADTMQAVAEHLQLEWDPGLLRPTRGGQAWHANSSAGTGPASVHTQALARWTRVLPAQEVTELERLLAPRMQAWGYEPVTPNAQRSALRRALLDVAVAREHHRLRRRWSRQVAGLAGA